MYIFVLKFKAKIMKLASKIFPQELYYIKNWNKEVIYPTFVRRTLRTLCGDSEPGVVLFWSGLECRTHYFRFSCKQKMTGAISSHLALVTVLWVELAAERHWKTYPRKFLLLETAGQVISGTFPMETFKTIHKCNPILIGRQCPYYQIITRLQQS